MQELPIPVPVPSLQGVTTLYQIREHVLGCHNCHLRNGCMSPVPGTGPLHTDVMFIGEAPGAVEDQEGKPFSGVSGQLLRTEALDAGIEYPYYTNVIKCKPPYNRDPSNTEIEACRPHLEDEIRIVNPRVIVAVGRYAMAQFMPDGLITKEHGKPRIVHGRFVLPIIHPAAALRRPEWLPMIRGDLRLVARLLDTPLESSPGATLTIL